MHWAKDGKYYLRSAKDKVIRGAHSRNNFRAYLPHKYKCLSHTSGAVRKERTAKAKVEKAQKSKVAAERRMKTATSERHKKSLERKVKEKSSKVRAAKARAQRKSNCMRKWRCGISGLNAPMSIAADGNVQCMSTNGRDCWWGRCRGRTVPRHGKLRPLKCGAMHKRVWGGTGYSSKGHWCNKVKAPVAKICKKKTGGKKKTNPKTGKVCNSKAGAICHGYNLKCFKSSLSQCKKACKADKRCNLAEYKAKTKHCCTSAIATKKQCKGRWAKANGWVGYNICR